MKKTVVLYFLFLFVQYCVGQQKSSWFFKDKPDNSTDELFNKYLKTTDSAEQKIRELYNLAKEDGLKKRYNNCILKIQTAFVLEKYAPKPCQATFDLNFLMGDILSVLNDDNAEIYFYKARAILNADTSISFEDRYNFFTNIAGIYIKQNKLDTALMYYRQAMDNAKLTKGNTLASANNNLGCFFAGINKDDSALFYFDNAMRYNNGIRKDTLLYCSIKDNIAQLEEKKNNFIDAIKIYRFNDSIFFLNKRYNRYLINKTRLLNTLEKVHSSEINSQINSVSDFLDKHKNDVFPLSVVNYYRFAADYYLKSDNKSKAFYFNKLYIGLRDSIEKTDNAKLNVIYGSLVSGLSTRFNNDIEMYKLMQEKSRQALFYSRLLIVISIITGAAIIYLLVLYIKKRKQQHVSESVIADIMLMATEADVRAKEAEVKTKDAELKTTVAELKTKELEKKAAEQELELKKKDITNLALHNTNIHDANKIIIERLQKISKTGENTDTLIKTFLVDLKNTSQMGGDSLVIQNNIETVNAEFYEKLNKLFPKLSKTEAELCGYVRINLSTKDISVLKNVEASSIKMAKTRLRKKLGISPDDDLYKFIQSI